MSPNVIPDLIPVGMSGEINSYQINSLIEATEDLIVKIEELIDEMADLIKKLPEEVLDEILGPLEVLIFNNVD